MNRSWLRSFLNLGARMHSDGVPVEDIERQEDTVLATLDHLVTHPGIVLADEVGMGKTFEALGVIAATLHRSTSSKIFIVTPGPDLNRNWMNAIATFSDPGARMYDFGNGAASARTLAEAVEHARTKSIVVVPVSAFQGARGGADQSYLISLFGHWKQLHGKTTNALLDRYRKGLERVDVTREWFLDAFEFDEIEPHIEQAFRGCDADAGLADIYGEPGDIEAFSRTDAIKRALDRARFRLVRSLIPDLELLVIDEAHKLKNPESLRHRGIATVFDRKYRRSLFLTATPFQLDISELRQVFSLFARGNDVPEVMQNEVDHLFASIADYQHNYDELERHWRRLDAAQAALFAEYYAENPDLEVLPALPTLVPVVESLRLVRDLKRQTIEPQFRQWMVRSIHDEKRTYRRHTSQTVQPAGDALLPFLVYERFIAELFRSGDTTHKAAVEINMVSSFEAAARGDLFSNERQLKPTVEDYRALLRDVLGKELSDHPKVETVVADAIAAANRHEKTLIFCGRVDTIRKLARSIEGIWEQQLVESWQRVYPGATRDEIFGVHGEDHRERGHAGRIRERLHRTQDLLYVALRERYLQTLVPASTVVIGHEEDIASRATELLRTLRVGATAASRLDYQLAKRCIERAAVERFRDTDAVPPQFQRIVDAMTSDQFLQFGIDLTPDVLEGDGAGSNMPTWTITAELVETLTTDQTHLWHTMSKDLARIRKADGSLDLELRVKAVERLARYLTRRDVLFLPELLAFAREQGLDVDVLHSSELLEVVDHFWATDAGAAWIRRLREFIHYFMKRPEKIRSEILDGPIAEGTFVRHTLEGDTREELREAFNTPLHPMVLLANEVMQEGLDLHHNCRRIVHHDLAWNPAQLEQRVGRIDRIGSLIRRMRESQPDERLEVRYPLIARTIDERMYRIVKKREKWLEFLLGARPDFNEFELDEHAAPLPPDLAESLVIDLRPQRAAD